MVFYRQDKTVSKTLDIQFRKYRLHFVTMICKNLFFFCVLKNDLSIKHCFSWAVITTLYFKHTCIFWGMHCRS